MSKTKIPAKLRYEVLNRDGTRCLWCGRGNADGVKLHVDHITPESFGGKTLYENLGTLCEDCNWGKSNDYPGNYLLQTYLKVPNLNSYIQHKNLKTEKKDGKTFPFQCLFRASISFYKKNIHDEFKQEKLFHEYLVSEDYLEDPDYPSYKIKISDFKKEAVFELKKKLRKFLYKEFGFLELHDNMLIFREFKKP